MAGTEKQFLVLSAAELSKIIKQCVSVPLALGGPVPLERGAGKVKGA